MNTCTFVQVQKIDVRYVFEYVCTELEFAYLIFFVDFRFDFFTTPFDVEIECLDIVWYALSLFDSCPLSSDVTSFSSLPEILYSSSSPLKGW